MLLVGGFPGPTSFSQIPCFFCNCNATDTQVCKKFKLQPRGSSGEHSQTVDAKWDISNKQRIGFTEVELVQKMIDGVSKVIALEQKLAAGEAIKDGIDF